MSADLSLAGAAANTAVRCDEGVSAQPPLGVYLHVPWCVRKCPYCDFNSHTLRGELPVADYLAALRADIAFERQWLDDRGMTLPAVSTVFIGGGTPSLLPHEAIGEALAMVDEQFTLAPGAEITLEANPGAADTARFAGYRRAGVNRLSVGVQSFSDARLELIGRVHDGDGARAALQAARQAGFERLNVDLMYALPGQCAAAAIEDVREALELGATHLSHYQLTVEPNTAFWQSPPALPDDSVVEVIEAEARAMLAAAGFERYEVSAFASRAERARHNLNYWRFGDYLGFGPGAHGKLTDCSHARQPVAWRTARLRHPRAWMEAARTQPRASIDQLREPVEMARIAFEFMLNATRLTEGIDSALFEARTGLAISTIAASLRRAEALDLLERGPATAAGERWRATERGFELLNDLQALFLDDAA